MSALLRQFARQAVCRRAAAAQRPYSTPAPTTYQQQVSTVTNVLANATTQPTPSQAPARPRLLSISENYFVSPGRFRVNAFDKEPIKRRLPKVGPGAKESRHNDAFYQLGIDPLDECMNASLLSHFVTDMGKIQNRAYTGLTWRSQRRLTKAIKRAKMMGVIPLLSRHNRNKY